MWCACAQASACVRAWITWTHIHFSWLCDNRECLEEAFIDYLRLDMHKCVTQDNTNTHQRTNHSRIPEGKTHQPALLTLQQAQVQITRHPTPQADKAPLSDITSTVVPVGWRIMTVILRSRVSSGKPSSPPKPSSSTAPPEAVYMGEKHISGKVTASKITKSKKNKKISQTPITVCSKKKEQITHVFGKCAYISNSTERKNKLKKNKRTWSGFRRCERGGEFAYRKKREIMKRPKEKSKKKKQ